MIIGQREDVTKLKNILQDKATKPTNFMSQINGGQYPVNDQIIANIEQYMKRSYSNQDLVSIAISNAKYGDVQIRGFKHHEVRNKVTTILEKIKSHKLPKTWV